jgi:hypothetical protein
MKLTILIINAVFSADRSESLAIASGEHNRVNNMIIFVLLNNSPELLIQPDFCTDAAV